MYTVAQKIQKYMKTFRRRVIQVFDKIIEEKEFQTGHPVLLRITIKLISLRRNLGYGDGGVLKSKAAKRQ